jgi:hypothetical protein
MGAAGGIPAFLGQADTPGEAVPRYGDVLTGFCIKHCYLTTDKRKTKATEGAGASMKGSIAFRIIVILCLCLAPAFGKENPEATANYEKALKQLKAGDLKVDFKALRLNCVESKYSCEADSDDRKNIAAFLNEKKFEDAARKADEAIEGAFVDIELHYFAFIANMELKEEEKAEFHKAVIKGLLDSIQENKHGRSEDDAFVVINVHEEYVFLGFSNMRVKGQSLAHKDGHSFDILECTDREDNRDVTVYFNVDIPMKRLRDALGQVLLSDRLV